MVILDLSAPLNRHLQCYPTDPPFKLITVTEYLKEGVNLSKLEMGLHSGTHVDAPLHFTADGFDIESMPLESFFGEAIVLETIKKEKQNIIPEDFCIADIKQGDIVLFRTGWEERSGSSSFFEGEWPGFSPETIDQLIKMKVKGIGGDIASADSPGAIRQGCIAHKKAAQANIPIFEALVNLKPLVGKRFWFAGFPLKITKGEASPIRAVAIVEDKSSL